MQNITDDFFSENEMVETINICMDLLYQYMNKKNTRYYSVYEEDIVDRENGTPTGDAVDTFTLEYPCMGIVSNLDTEQPPVFTGVTGDGEDLSYSHFILRKGASNREPHYTFESDRTGIRRIKTSKKYEKIHVIYKRGPRRVTAGNLENPLDIPEQLVGALLKFCLWMIAPTNLEQGASIANYHKNEATEFIGTYEDILGHDLRTGFYSGH